MSATVKANSSLVVSASVLLTVRVNAALAHPVSVLDQELKLKTARQDAASSQALRLQHQLPLQPPRLHPQPVQARRHLLHLRTEDQHLILQERRMLAMERDCSLLVGSA